MAKAKNDVMIDDVVATKNMKSYSYNKKRLHKRMKANFLITQLFKGKFSL